MDEERHVGDLGNVEADSVGKIDLNTQRERSSF